MPKARRTTRSDWDDVPLPRHIVVLLLAFALLVATGCGSFLYTMIPAWLAANHTQDIARAQNSATRPVSTAPAQASATVPAQLSPTATAQPDPTAAVVAVANPYPPHMATTALNDPLSDNSQGNQWDSGTFTRGGQCTFTAGAYHVTAPAHAGLFDCNAEAHSFSDFTYQVQMTILQGNQGGIFFRQRNALGPYYSFSIGTDGSYTLRKSDGLRLSLLRSGISLAIKTGLNQPNVLAVVAQGSTITLYINGQLIDQLSDTASLSGLIGVATDAQTQQAEVTYSNAQVWTP
ncbi:MAG: hypothetical protein JOZ18_13980 [Chloroflexi bacterium]|nr:hypothetical protein [Chloroflexota bacterium]